MRKIAAVIIGLLFVAVTAAYAESMHIQCFGATQVVNGGDTLFIFKGDIHVKSTIGSVNWHSIETGNVETGIEEQLNLDEGGYFLEKGGVKYEPFYVFKCPVADVKMSMTHSCDNSVLHLTGNVSPFSYTRPDGTAGSCARTYSLQYTALAWNGEIWADSLVETTGRLSRTISLPALYGPTEVALCYDKDIRSKLDLDSVCVTDSLLADSVVAVNFHMESLATIRGEKGEKSNELNRPTDQKCITATTSDDYSGALEVAFYSNATPNPNPVFYRWAVYKASKQIATRNDQDIRYTFSEPGNYRVVCSVNTYQCQLDSQEMKVNISESYLRVPNVFTPNGDGKNDEFRVSYRSLREFHIWVYNRWGKLVYESDDPAKGWDGTINGRPAAASAYFYVIRAMGTDAAKGASYSTKISYNKKQKMNDQSIIGIYQMSGDINLLRGKKK